MQTIRGAEAMTRDEATLLLKTIGRFVGAQVKPLQAEIANT
jgi:hypothetical protein